VNAQPSGVLVPLFDDDASDAVKPIFLRLPTSLVEKVAQIARRETALRRQRGLKGVITRTDVVQRFLEMACENYESTEGLDAPDSRRKGKK
jgi:hypothetical protein